MKEKAFIETYYLSSWGITAMCAGTVHNMAGLVVDRCFLGVFEAAFGAGAPYFLSLFYHRRELGFRVSILLGTSPLANCFASALAYGITQIKHSIAPWRLLFLIGKFMLIRCKRSEADSSFEEGAPTILFAPIVFFLLPDSPETAKFLTEDERTEAVERLQMIDTTGRQRVEWTQILSGLTDYKNYVHMAIHFCCNYSFAGLSNFLPTIIMDMGYSSVRAQGLTAPPYLAAFLCCIAAAFVSDRFGVRGYIISAFGCMGTIGYILLAAIQDQTQTGPRYLGVWLATCGIFPALALNITWLLNNQGGDSKRGSGMAVLAVLGQCSSFVSSSVFPKEDGPTYVKGCAIGSAFTGMIVVLSLGLRFKLEHENRKRDRLYGVVDQNARIDVTDDGDYNTRFRYLT